MQLKETKSLDVINKIFGRKIKRLVRKWGVAILTPIQFAVNTGHFRSSLAEKAVTNDGKPLPWLTYPAIDFLVTRDFSASKVLEFGGGQSTAFWSTRAKTVVTFETDEKWISQIQKLIKSSLNVTIIKAPNNMDPLQERFVSSELEERREKFDVIIIDGLQRAKMFTIAMRFLNDNGLIICDNVESFPFKEAWQQFPDLLRIDFYGHSPGVIHPHLTSILFDGSCKFTSVTAPVYARAYQIHDFPYPDRDNYHKKMS